MTVDQFLAEARKNPVFVGSDVDLTAQWVKTESKVEEAMLKKLRSLVRCDRVLHDLTPGERKLLNLLGEYFKGRK